MNGTQKKEGIGTLIYDKIDFKCKTIISDKEDHYIIIKGSFQQKHITIVNIYAPNIRAPKYIKQMLTDPEGEIDYKNRGF